MSEEEKDVMIRRAQRDVSKPVGLAGAPSYSMKAPLENRLQQNLQTMWVSQLVFKGAAPTLMYCKPCSVFVTPSKVGTTGMSYFDYLHRDHADHRDEIVPCDWESVSKLGAGKYRELMQSFTAVSYQIGKPVRCGPQLIAHESVEAETPVPKYCPLTKLPKCSRFAMMPEEPETCVQCLQDRSKSKESLKRYFEQTEEQKRRQASFEHLKRRIKQ
jgi:hypothetical protein